MSLETTVFISPLDYIFGYLSDLYVEDLRKMMVCVCVCVLSIIVSSQQPLQGWLD